MKPRQFSFGFVALACLLTSLPQIAPFASARPIGQEAEPIAVGTPIRGTLAGGAVHNYTLRLEAGQYGNAVVEQRGIDVVVRVFGPDGKQLVEVDSPNGIQGPEPVQIIAESGGAYRLEVSSLEPGAAAGNYEVRVEEVRTATEKDRQLVEAFGLDNECTRLRTTGKPKQAIPLAERALALYEKALSPEDPSVLNALSILANLYRVTGADGKAEPLYLRLIAAKEKAFGPDHLSVAAALNDLGVLYTERRDFQKAEPLFARTLAIREAALGPDHPALANVLTNMALLYRAMGAYAKAEPLFVRVIAIKEKALGPNHPEVAVALNNLTLIYLETAAYDRAEPLLLRALAIREKALGPDHPDVAVDLNNLASLYRLMGEYERAVPLFVRALANKEKALGPDHDDVGSVLSNLALLYQAMGRYAKAEPLFVRALAIHEKALGPDHPSVATALNNLADLYRALGASEKAEPLFLRAIAIDERAFGPENRQMTAPLNNLALLYKQEGEYAKAERLLVRTLAIDEKVFGPDHPAVALALVNLGSLYRVTGAYEKAEPLFLRSVAANEKRLGPAHPEVARSLTNLADLYCAQGAYAKAEPLLVRSLAVDEKALGPDHPDVACALANLGKLYRLMGANAKAEAPLARALAIYEKAFGPEHPTVASLLTYQASLYMQTGAYSKAEKLYQRALAIQEKSLGPDNPDVAQSLDSLALLYQTTEAYAKAIDYRARANDTRERDLARNLLANSEARKLQYLKLVANDVDRTISLHERCAPRDARACRLALEIVLRRKGRALDAMTDAIEALRRRASPEDVTLLDDLAAARDLLSRRTLADSGRIDAEAFKAEIAGLEQRVEQLESTVASRSAEFRAASLPITLSAVQSQIPTGTMLVEFVSYAPFVAKTQTSGKRRYAVYTLGPKGEPGWADLGEAEALDEAVGALRAQLRNRASDGREMRRQARALDQRLMRPVRALAGRTTHLLICPDGELSMLPFAALVDEHDRYLVENYTLSYLTSGRDLLRLAVAAPSGGRPLILANPEFGPRAPSAGDERGGTSGLADVFFAPLAGTGEEAEALSTILPEVDVVTGEEATEGRLKAVRAPRILHIATHGFFLGGAASAPGGVLEAHLLDQSATDRSLIHDDEAYSRIESPLLRSGLGLAGANTRHGGGGDDGILTALEVAGMDLWGTELVVLSACDTGVGEVKRGDGIYGLRRALVLAGARTQVMSLWPVSDQGTRDLMTGYYKALLAGAGRSEGLRRVQLTMLADPKRSHPYYWASFIQSGDWTPLGTR